MIILLLGGLLLALDLSEERYFSCIDKNGRLGPSPFVWKTFSQTSAGYDWADKLALGGDG